MKPVIYNREVERQGILRRAHHIGYKRVLNDLHTSSFDLPALDDDVLLCENTHYIVDIYDGERYIDKFRITGQPQQCVTDAGAVYRYACDHVIAFLADCRIDGYLEIGGTGVSTRTVLETLLARQNEEWGFVRWKLGRCEFDYYFQYAFENTDVLNALYSVPKCFLDGYHWTFDTSTYPWTINLIRRDTDANCMIQYRRNLKWIKRTKDVSNLCTRLYCLGSGEGVNQTNIKRLTGGVNYIESATKSKHGVIAKHLIDRSISDDELLYAKGRAMLAEIDEPMYSYVVGGLDLHRRTGLAYDLMDEGKVVRVQDEDAGIDFTKPILSVEKKDVELDPLGIEITVANKTEDIASTIENLSARAAITAQYSQGATNLFPMQVTDNADADHPAKFRFYVPDTCAKINAVKLSWQLAQFRAYETGAAAGGGEVTSTVDGGGGERTSSSGGSYSKTIPEKTLSIGATGGPMADEGTSALYTEANTSGLETDSAGRHKHATESHSHNMNRHTHASTSSGPDPVVTVSVAPATEYASAHTHGVSAHTHKFSHWHKVTGSVTIPEISISIPSHSHTVSIPSHRHILTLLDHKHDIVYGIYEGGMANSVSINVDGNDVPASKLVDGNGHPVSELDVVEYMETDNDGRITRGTWHEIDLMPDSLTRIEAFLFVQTFVRSYSGGEY